MANTVKIRRILHTKFIDDSEMLCGINLGGIHGWDAIDDFIARTSERHISRYEYSYCEKCKELIPAMVWLNYVEL